MDQCQRPSLIIAANCQLHLGQQMLGRNLADLLQMVDVRPGLPMEKIAAPVHPVECHLIGPQNQTGNSIAAIARPDHIPPGVGRIAGVYPDRIAMDTT